MNDLRFHPCENRNLSTLTSAQIDDFNRDGFIKPVRLFNDDEMWEHRAYFDALLARVLTSGQHSYSISAAHVRYGRVYDLLTNPRVVNIVAEILGDDIIGWGAHYFCKLPGDGKRVSWHQDASYWPLTPSKSITVWLAIDDSDAENACMRFIPGSHKLGHLTFHMSEDDENNVLNQTVNGAELYGAPVNDELRSGEASLHSDLTLHGSESNTSTRRRCGLALRYCAADVRALKGWNAKGVIVRGSDPTGHWANLMRPVED